MFWQSDPKLEEIDMTQIVTLQKQMCKHSNEHVKNVSLNTIFFI